MHKIKGSMLAASLALFIPIAAGGQNLAYSTDRPLTAAEKSASMNVVSLIRVLANPKEWQGKTIAVQGLLHHRFEDQRLYLSRDDARYLIEENALHVSLVGKGLLLQTLPRKPLPKSPEDAIRFFDDKFVLVVGRYDKGHLKSVSRILQLQAYPDNGR